VTQRRGIVYVVYGQRAALTAAKSIASLQATGCTLPITVIGDRAIPPAAHVDYPRLDQGGRLTKLAMLELMADYDYLLYLDADTRIHGDPTPGFAIVEDGWDMALALSGFQGNRAFEHVQARERTETFDAIGAPLVQYQCGVLFVARSDTTRAFFGAWRDEWGSYATADQAAFVRALERVPLRLWLLGNDWNGVDGEIVEHRFGEAREL